MTEYHIVKVKLSDSQLDKLMFATKNVTGVTQSWVFIRLLGIVYQEII